MVVDRKSRKTGRTGYTVITGNKGKPQPKKKALYRLLAAVAVLLCLYAACLAVKKVLTRLFVGTVIAGEGTLEQKLAAEGVLVRDEKVARAPVSGTLHWLVREGERLAFGSPVAEIVTAGGDKHLVTAPAAGIVGFSLDGWEGELQPVFLENIDPLQVKKAGEQHRQAKEGALINKGSLLFKVINNYTWYFAAELQEDRFAELEGAATVDVCFSFAPDMPVSAKIVGNEGKKQTNIILQVEQEVPGCSRIRFATADLISRRVRGIVIPASAVIIREEETGVYEVRRSVVRYCPVEVVAAEGEQVVITGISPGTPVITNPGWVKEGQRI